MCVVCCVCCFLVAERVCVHPEHLEHRGLQAGPAGRQRHRRHRGRRSAQRIQLRGVYVQQQQRVRTLAAHCSLLRLLGLNICCMHVLSRYNPVFPASSPYTTAVGATMGPQSGSPEVACQSQLG